MKNQKPSAARAQKAGVSLPQSKIDAVLKDYKAGVPVKKIATKHNVSKTTVTNYVRANGGSNRKYKKIIPVKKGSFPKAIGPDIVSDHQLASKIHVDKGWKKDKPQTGYMQFEQNKDLKTTEQPEMPPPQPRFDPVNRPEHYTNTAIEVIDFIEDKNLDFHLGNTVKYVIRAGRKDPSKEIQDLEKAAWYLNRKIANLKAGK